MSACRVGCIKTARNENHDDSLVSGFFNETKMKEIKQVLHATKMPPKAFSGAAPPRRA